MTIRFYTLAVTGPGKKPAKLEFNGKSHLVFGPTDTGKSYVVECLRYCLGSEDRPKDVGYSEGYTRVALQIGLSDDEKYTFFRDLTIGDEFVYSGFHILPPQDETELVRRPISELLPFWCNGAGKRILVKAGQLGNLTAGDLRRISIFDEIRTLDNVAFQGKDTNLRTRNRSTLDLILTGTDDSDIALQPSTKARDIAKGHIEALTEEIQNLIREIPDLITKKDAEEGLVRVTNEIESINGYLRNHLAEIDQLKQEGAKIESENRELTQRIAALDEARNRFNILDKKYSNDLQRLQAINTAAAIIPNFETRPCPLCLTDIQHQVRHQDSEEQAQILWQAAKAERDKILVLQEGLKGALEDVDQEILDVNGLLIECNTKAKENLRLLETLVRPATPNLQQGLVALTERKTILTVAIRNIDRIERLQLRLKDMKRRSTRRKQVIERDIAKSAELLCGRIEALLTNWGVPGVESIHFDEPSSDIEINHRKRTSYGKGKRAIFLTAYMVALMELAIERGYPHLGVIVVDSPVVTYKDPKYGGHKDPEELLDESVKDRFYAWLAERQADGQVIVLENEHPDNSIGGKLHATEFVGPNLQHGRPGFFPV